ncbi:VOC family protein [Rhodococcus opacus]|uniref:VOC family protein n=1 Tax=Rhodococcus opacus TaxID=37919 RepID=UPI0024B99E17|nr:VOC family protein [Rhodococcus opacus]MDJ0419817.1 VOC family protein [Rhodococcus opacus]
MSSPAKLAHIVLRTQHVKEMRDWYMTVLDGKIMGENPAEVFITYDDEHHRVALVDMSGLGDHFENPEGAVAAASGSTTLTRARPAKATADTDVFAALAGPATGLFHVAFTYNTIDELFSNYERLAEAEIWPVLSMNHGVTTSMYYRDPEDNLVELQIDNFATAQEAEAFMHGETWLRRPGGVPIDIEELITRFHSGEPFTELVKPNW